MQPSSRALIGDYGFTGIPSTITLKMDSRYMGDILKHLEKQSEHLMDSCRSMSHELHKLQIEEEMLMHKFYEIMSAHGLNKKNLDRSNAPDYRENGDCNHCNQPFTTMRT